MRTITHSARRSAARWRKIASSAIDRPGKGIADELASLDDIRPDALVLALGFDPSVEEPLGSLRISDDGFARAAQAAAALDLPTVVTQEGGYAVDALGRLLGRFLAGWGG